MQKKMLIQDCIKGRKSVRKYSDKEVTQEDIKEVIELARCSPSWKNTQITRYHVVKTPEIKEEIANNCVMGFEFNSKRIKECSALVVVTYVKNVSGFEPDGSFSTSKGDAWEMFDAGIASQTFSLAAHANGLGCVILGIFDEEKLAETISVPEGEKVAAIIAVGYPIEGDTKPGPAKKTVEELVTFI